MEIVEKVGRAIHASSFIGMGWDTLNVSEKESYFAAARAAIKATAERNICPEKAIHDYYKSQIK